MNEKENGSIKNEARVLYEKQELVADFLQKSMAFLEQAKPSNLFTVTESYGKTSETKLIPTVDKFEINDLWDQWKTQARDVVYVDAFLTQKLVIGDLVKILGGKNESKPPSPNK